MKVLVSSCYNVTVAGGVEIHGLHATVAPRRPLQDSPVLEEFSFIPYKEVVPPSGGEDLADYVRQCIALTKQGLKSLLAKTNGIKLVNKDIVEAVVNGLGSETVEQVKKGKTGEREALLSVLEEIFTNSTPDNVTANVQTALREHAGELCKDRLLSNLHHPRTLKTCLDLVVENRIAHKLRLLEVGGARGLYRRVLPQLNTQPLLQIEYTLSEDAFDKLDSEELEGLGVKAIQWDITMETAPTNIGTHDLVMAANCLHTCAHPASALAKLCTLIKEDGFLLIQEVTENFPAYITLDIFQKELQDFDAEKCFGLYLPQDGWRKLIAEAGLEIVAEKSDDLLSTLFLCRKACNLGPGTKLLPVNDLHCSWVEMVKTQLVEFQSKPRGDNLWLLVDQERNSGIVGMVNCLHQEPGGDRLRYT